MTPKTRLALLFVLFIVFGAISMLKLVREQSRSSVATVAKQIAIKDTSAINQIIVRNSKGNLVLERRGSEWVVDNKYTVRKQLMQILLFGLNQLAVKRPAPNNNNEAINLLNQKGSVATIRSGNQSQSFRIITNPNDLNTAYYLGSEGEPLIVYVPGVKGNLSNILNLNNADWRSRQLFSMRAIDVSKIRLEYKDKQRQGFEIDNKGEKPYILGVSSPDQNKINKFINLVNILSVDGYLSSDSLKGTPGVEPDVVMHLELRKTPAYQKLLVYYNKNQPNILTGWLDPPGEAVKLNAQIYKLVFVDKRFFEAK